MEIIKKPQLIEKIREYKLIPVEVKVLDISNRIFLGMEEIEEFLKFVSNSNLGCVYYYYTYYSSEKYIIPEDDYNDKYEKKLKNEVRRYNKQIETLDFDSPKSLILFVLQNGSLVGIELYYPWIENKGIEAAEYASDEIENKFPFEVKRAKIRRKDNKKEDENKLREIIFDDPEFAMHSKNQDLRYWYLADLLDKEDMKQYRYLVHPYGIPSSGKAKVFMDITLMLYKERKKE
ncbi:hypothetical protein [Lentibacillus sediminis]|uniref:hypothetical protein n=1 Tax=Lentibacillus sediminis TaxID=1940529 RepID=UPI000C1BB6F6|nr:hypothetical protein [Lentibacillus sediminis]